MTGASLDAAPAPRPRRDRETPRDVDPAARQARREARGAAGSRAKEGTGRPGRRFARRAGNYFRTVLWTVRDSFAAEPRRLALALVLGGLALAVQAIAVLVVFGYGQAIQQDAGLVVPFLGIDWAARTDTALLLAVVAVFAGSLSAAVVLNFASRGLLLAIIRRSLARSVERLARAALHLPDPRAPRASRLVSGAGFTALSGGATASARSSFLIVQTLPALFGALLAAAALFWLEPVLTAILVVVAAVWSALLYPVSLRVVAFGRRLRRASGTIRQQHGLVSPSSEWAPAQEMAVAYTGWLRTRAEMALVVGVGIAVIVAIAISVIGAEMMSGRQDWPVLIAYVGALQVALSGVFRSISAVAIVSRSYPQMVRNRQFVLDMAGLGRPAAAPRPGEMITLGATAGGEPVTASVGERLAMMTDEAIQRVQMTTIGAHDANGTPVRSAMLWRGPTAGIDDGSPILFVDARLLVADDGPAGPYPDRLLIVVHPTPSSVGQFGESRLLVAEGQEIVRSVAVGSDEATSLLARIAKRAARREGQRQDQHLDDDGDL